jgi:uncharacterized protein YegP (UPF0339 family)
MPKPRGKIMFYDAGPIYKLRHYWRILSANNQIVADSSEGYSSQAKARQGFAAAIKIATEYQATIKRSAIVACVDALAVPNRHKLAKRRQRAT